MVQDGRNVTARDLVGSCSNEVGVTEAPLLDVSDTAPQQAMDLCASLLAKVCDASADKGGLDG